MVGKNNLHLGQKVLYSGKRTRNLKENSEGVIVKGKFNSRRTPLVRFDNISVYIPKDKLQLLDEVVDEVVNEITEPTPSQLKRKVKLDQWKRVNKLKKEKEPSKYDLILDNRELVKNNRSKRKIKREELRISMKDEIYRTECDKENNKIGSVYRQLDNEILKLKEEIKNNPEKECENKAKISEINNKQKGLKKTNSIMKFMYANGHYTMEAHSSTTYFDLCLGKKVHFSPKPRVMEVEESEETNA
tara:strand:- start:2581 stop:3315 length:735 start_codon:yes stop_codon:yes gene_type:complete